MVMYRTSIELQEAVADFQRDNKSRFICLTKTGGINECDWKVLVKGQKKIQCRWETSKELAKAPCIEYNGTPFVQVGRWILGCHLGKDKNASQKKKYKKEQEKKNIDDHDFFKRNKMVQPTKKQDCPAVIYVTQIVCFPKEKASNKSEWSHRGVVENLKKKIAKDIDSVEGEVQFHVKFPALLDHKNHPTDGKTSDFYEAVEEKIKNHVIKLTHDGVRSVSEMRRHITSFVQSEYGDVDMNRRRYSPTISDLRNLMWKAKTKNRHSSATLLDMEDEVTNFSEPVKSSENSSKNYKEDNLKMLKNIVDYVQIIGDNEVHKNLNNDLKDIHTRLLLLLPRDSDLVSSDNESKKRKVSPVNNAYVQLPKRKNSAEMRFGRKADNKSEFAGNVSLDIMSNFSNTDSAYIPPPTCLNNNYVVEAYSLQNGMEISTTF